VTWQVYALSDPRDGAMRYVGKSSNPARRLAAHCSPTAAAPVRAWVLEMASVPRLEILATVTTETEALMLEQGWIAKLRASGAKLLNGSLGGERQAGVKSHRFSGIGDRVRSRRMALRMNQHDVALASGLEQPKLSRLEHGKRTQITAESAVLIARALRCSVEWLVTGDATVEEPAPASQPQPTAGKEGAA
jgi:predicted GIY-YIG superfamily endonuclease/DNA-binding Xre family transcriptional regulator